ncbi:MAG: phospholipase D family protein [Candidatus Micrarchaeia archaeon]|jgi:phosphatidylserine/phosphatidylglycerophosphate/cardiolipin synthase-like enzyme
MLIEKDGIKISFGRAVGHILEDLIGSAKQRVYVISPWLSPKYANLLLQKKEKGCDVFLITTNDFSNKQHASSLQLLLDKTKEEPKFRKYWKFSAILAFLFLFFSIFSILFLFLSLSFFIFSFYLFLQKEKVTFSFKIPMIVYDKDNDFTHSKLYILDNVAILSSANFTESGLWRNIEEIVIFSDEKIVNEIVGIFERTKENELIKHIPPDEIGEKVEE